MTIKFLACTNCRALSGTVFYVLPDRWVNFWQQEHLGAKVEKSDPYNRTKHARALEPTRQWHVTSDPIPADRGSLPSAAGLDGPDPQTQSGSVRVAWLWAGRARVGPRGLASPLQVWQIIPCPRGRCGRRGPRDAPGHRRSESPSSLL